MTAILVHGLRPHEWAAAFVDDAWARIDAETDTTGWPPAVAPCSRCGCECCPGAQREGRTAAGMGGRS